MGRTTRWRSTHQDISSTEVHDHICTVLWLSCLAASPKFIEHCAVQWAETHSNQAIDNEEVHSIAPIQSSQDNHSRTTNRLKFQIPATLPTCNRLASRSLSSRPESAQAMPEAIPRLKIVWFARAIRIWTGKATNKTITYKICKSCRLNAFGCARCQVLKLFPHREMWCCH